MRNRHHSEWTRGYISRFFPRAELWRQFENHGEHRFPRKNDGGRSKEAPRRPPQRRRHASCKTIYE